MKQNKIDEELEEEEAEHRKKYWIFFFFLISKILGKDKQGRKRAREREF